MSDTYTKLFRSLAASTIVSEPLATRWLWVTLISQSDQQGRVYASIPGLARLANITVEETETALSCFMSPDNYSRTPDNEGRRLSEIDGGWQLLNHAKYNAMRGSIERAEYKRKWDRENRPSGHKRGREQSDSPTKTRQSDAQSDTNPTKPDSPTPYLISHISEEKSKSKNTERQAARFDEFWTAYPCKKGKSDARRSWSRKGLDAIADRIIADVKAREASDRQWLEGYVPHGSTYVNSEGWEDAIEAPKGRQAVDAYQPLPGEC